MYYLGSKTIETNRLVLKAQTMEEQYYLWSILMQPDVNRYYLTVPKKLAEKLKIWEKQKEYYKEDMKHANDLDIFRWSIFLKETGQCIGRVSCHPASDENPEICNPSIRGVGWFIDPKFKGNGYGNEAAKAMMNYMFSECEIDEIRTGAAIQNPASWMIMENFGFVKLNGTKMVQYTYLDEPVEAYQYHLTRQMYFENKNRQN